MRDNNLKPFNISYELSDVAKRNVFALRYAVTHDIFHILLGFDTTYAGEIGVLAFASEQNYSKRLKTGLWMVMAIYPILNPSRFQEIFANVRKRREMGKKVKFLLSYRFEEHWEQSLDEVKAELGFT